MRCKLFTNGSRIRLFIVTCATGVASSAFAQSPLSPGRLDPQCNSETCADEAVVIATVDSLRRTESCRGGLPKLLRTIYVTPYTAFSDGVTARRSRYPIPSAPAVALLEDLGMIDGRRWRGAIELTDTIAVLREGVPEQGCLFVFSPVDWMHASTARMLVGEYSRAGDSRHIVLVQRERGSWRVVSVTTGPRS